MIKNRTDAGKQVFLNERPAQKREKENRDVRH